MPRLSHSRATAGVNELSRTIDGLKTTWQALKSAVKTDGKSDGAGFDPLDPMGTKARGEADTANRKAVTALAEQNPSDPSVGSYGARDTDGMLAGMALAQATIAMRRRTGETYRERKERIYQTTKVRGARAAEAESMQKMKEQFGSYLAPDGQSFKPGTDARELVDEALSQFSGVVLTAAAEIGRATGQNVTGENLGRSIGAIPVPQPRPASKPGASAADLPDLSRIPLPAARPDLAGPIREEGERAAQAAEAAGQRVAAAFNVTATPQIDASSIRAANQEAIALENTLRRLANNMQNAARGARVRTQQMAEDYEDVNADTGN